MLHCSAYFLFCCILLVFLLLRDIVLKLLQYEASTNVADNKGYFPIHLAAWKGDVEIVKILIHHGPSHSRVNEQVHLTNICSCYDFSRVLRSQRHIEKLIISIFTLPKTFLLLSFLKEKVENFFGICIWYKWYKYGTLALSWTFVKIFVNKKIPHKGSSCSIFACFT